MGQEMSAALEGERVIIGGYLNRHIGGVEMGLRGYTRMGYEIQER